MASDRAAGGSSAGRRPAGRPSTARSAGMTRREKHARAMQALDANQFGVAERLYRELTQDDATDAPAAFYLAQIYAAQERHQEALELARQAVDAAPKQPLIRSFYVHTLITALRPDEAIAEARALCEMEPDDVQHWVRLARLCEQAHDIDGAREAIDRALACDANDVNAAIVHATILDRQKRPEDAIARLEAVDAANADVGMRHLYWKFRAKLYDRAAQHERAFEMLAQADRVAERLPRVAMTDRTYRERLTSHLRGVDGRPAYRQAQLLHRHGQLESFDRNVAFLVGFPRSGTTMLGQVFGAHPDVVIADERATLQDVLRCALETHDCPPDQLGRLFDVLETDEINSLRSLYWERAAKHAGRVPPGGVLVDKQPMNIMLAGVLNVLFPEAPLMTLLRDPRDVCLSAYMQSFVINEMSVNFFGWRRTASFYAMVMSFWRWLAPQLTMPWIEIRYEDLIDDLEGRSKTLFEFIDHPWHEDVLRFHETARDRAVNTPSYEAVTRPVNRSAVERWRAYHDRMVEVDDLLGPLIEAFGYPPTSG